jgi:acyl dehydratase
VVTEVTELTPRGRRRGLVVWRRKLINQQGTVLQEGILETLVETAPKGEKSEDDSQ